MSFSSPEVRVPRQLPDLRLWIAEQWKPGRTFDRSSPMLTGPYGHVGGYAEWERRNLKDATLWWVTPEMVDLLNAAAANIPEDITPADLVPPSPSGFVLFTTPIVSRDARDPANATILVDAIVWGRAMLPPLPGREDRGVSTIGVSSYRKLDFDEGLTGREMTKAVTIGGMDFARREDGPLAAGTLTTEDLSLMTTPEQIEEFMQGGLGHMMTYGSRATGKQVTLHGEAWIPMGRSDWPLTDRLDEPPWEMEDFAFDSFKEDRRLLAALFTLLAQEGITSRTVERDRPAAKRTRRAGIEYELADVVVIKLRRPKMVGHEDEENPEETSGREWSHRWIVDGHWRWQACGKGHAERRLTYINAHVKGPEDKPLKVPERVHVWQQ